MMVVLLNLVACGTQNETEDPSPEYASRTAWKAMYPEAAAVMEEAWHTGWEAGTVAWSAIYPEAASETVGVEMVEWEARHPEAASALEAASVAAGAALEAAWKAKYPGAAAARDAWDLWAARYSDAAEAWRAAMFTDAEMRINAWEAANKFPPPGSRVRVPQRRLDARVAAHDAAQIMAVIAAWEVIATEYPDAARAAPRNWPPR